ncbi:MAG: DNA processing protein DprA [Pelagibaca sp.]|nr:DNA processing protein DprA [Pelagibaca sp.]
MNVPDLLSPTAQVTLLLTSYFSKVSANNAKPLSIAEWGRFAWWLKEKSATPADLLKPESRSLLQSWHDTSIGTDRILELLDRGHSLALAMEKWQRAGLWVVTRSDPEYPTRLKQKLKNASPPVLFGCGNKALLNAGGLAVIGSRNASETDLGFTGDVGIKAASEGIAIVSGGARGVDEAAMLGAVNHGGSVIGVMADSLLKAATSSKWRKGLMENRAVLISPFYPEAGFNAGNAMARNKYIYCLSDSSLVIHSGRKGGTLNGAEENLKNFWVPLWVKPTTDSDAANADLVKKGGRWLDADANTLLISHLIMTHASKSARLEDTQADMFSAPAQSDLLADSPAELPKDVSNANVEVDVAPTVSESVIPVAPTMQHSDEDETTTQKPVDFYRLFVNELNRLAQKPVTVNELIDATQLSKTQVSDWLKRAEADHEIKKLTRPVRYQVNIKQ